MKKGEDDEKQKERQKKERDLTDFFFTYKKIRTFHFFFYQNHDDQEHMIFFIFSKFLSKHDYNEITYHFIASVQFIKTNFNFIFIKQTKNIFL